MGVGVYYAFDRCSQRKDQLAKIAVLEYVLGVVFLGGLVLIALLEHIYYEQIPRYLIASRRSSSCSPRSCSERIYGVCSNNKTILLLGEASYIVYLIHPYIVFSVLRLVVKDAALGTPAIIGVTVVLLAMTGAISIAIHLWFEKPAMAYLRRMFS